MHDRRLLCRIEAGEVGHRGVQAEEAVERQGLVRAVEAEGDLLAQRLVGRIADRRHGGQSVERAAQDDHHQPRIAAARGAGEARHEGPGEQRAGAADDGAARRRDE